MNRFLKPGVGVLILTLGMVGCATPPPSKPVKAIAKAPVIDRSTRSPSSARPAPPDYPYPGQPTYPQQSAQPYPSPQVEVGQLPREDPLTPREYASPTYPETPYPAERYPTAPPARAYPPEGGYSQAPTYPPGAAYPQQPDYSPDAAYPQQPDYSPDALPPVAPRPSRPAAPVPAPRPEPQEETIALAPPIETDLTPVPPVVPETPPAAPRPAAPARPAELPPAEITREGNQAVVALLDSADKYVKGGQLDKAGAALERALRIEPRNAGIWHDLAQIRLHQGQYQQAESLASKSNNLANGNRSLQSRNWKLISVARKAGGNTAGAEEAEAQASLLSR